MTRAPSPADTKACCAVAYESEWARLLLGDSFHPGGTELTLHLGPLLELGPRSRVLDVACGRGASAIALAREFDCSVHGLDLSRANVKAASEAAHEAGVSNLVSFGVADAESLPCDDGVFDAVLCECAFCIFTSKSAAANEFARVLRPGGRVGLSDLTREGAIAPELDTLLGRVACLADARPVEEYAALLRDAGFHSVQLEPHDDVLCSLASQVRLKLLAVEVAARLGKARVPLAEVLQAKRLAKLAAGSLQEGKLGYAIVVGTRD